MTTNQVNLHTWQARLVLSDAPHRVVEAARRGGKALAWDTPIPTPGGWKAIGMLRVGDEVFDERGQPCTVTETSDVQLGNQCYDVVFSDGTVITADAEHLWETHTKAVRQSRKRSVYQGATPPTGFARHTFPEVVTTDQIRQTLSVRRQDRKTEANHAIPNALALDLPDADLPIDPYVFGAWLGDGHSTGAAITTMDKAMLTELAWAGVETSRWNRSQGLADTYGLIGLHGPLHDLGVWGNKHIPMQYLRASRQQRLALVQGLMDTDGYVDKRGKCEFSVVNKALADGFYEAIVSLGIRAGYSVSPAKLYGVQKGWRYRIVFRTDLPVCRLPRKASRLKAAQGKGGGQRDRRFIVEVAPRPTVPVRCIVVDSPSHLFLASKGMVPTHNSRGSFHALEKDISEKMPVPVPSYQQPPYHAWIVVPNFPQSNQVWTELMAFIPEEHMAAPPNQEYKRITLKGAPGGRAWGLIEVKSAHDPGSLQTAGLDFLWVSEAQDISNAAFERMSPMLHSPERPLKAIWEGIPALWRDHWFWRICEAAQRGDRGYEYFHWTFYDNPLLTQEQIEDIEQEREILTDAAWRRMYLAERTESAGFFKNIDAQTGGDLLVGPLPATRYVAGLDLGRMRDATVLWILDANSRRGVYHQRWDAGEDWSQQREGVVHACNRFGVQRMHVDATGMGGDMFCEALEEAGLPIERFNIQAEYSGKGGELVGSRMDILNNFAISMERQNCFFPYVPELIREMRAFQWLKTGGRQHPRPDHPEGEHDDEIFSYGMGLLLCEDIAPEIPRLNSGRGRSYFPQGSNQSTWGARAHRDRIQQKMLQRWERSGIIL